MAEIITVDSTEKPKPETKPETETSTPSLAEGPGARLAQARVAMSLSQAQICERLKFTQSTLTQIENDDYTKDIPVTFYRGYLRAYAYVVKLDPESLIADFNSITSDLDEETPMPSRPLDTVTISHDERFRTRGVKSKFGLFLLLTALFIGVFATAYWFVKKAGWFELAERSESNSSVSIELPYVGNPSAEAGTAGIAIGDNDSGTDVPKVQTETSESEVATNYDNEVAVPTTSGLNQDTVLPNPEVAPVTYLKQPVDESAEDSDNEVSSENSTELPVGSELTMRFTDDCWVKVTDHQNEVMVLGLKKQGAEIAISIVPPIRVTLGDPRAVSMSFNNKAVALSQYKAGRPVNFTLN